MSNSTTTTTTTTLFFVQKYKSLINSKGQLSGKLGENLNRYDSKGGFPLSCNFHVRTHVNFTRVNKIEAMFGKSGVNVKVAP